MGEFIARAYRALLFICGLSAGLSIASLAILITADVILRNLGIINFPWLLEVSEYVIYISTFIAAPWVLQQGSHVRVDLVVTIIPERAAHAANVVAEFLGLAASATLAWHGLRVTWDTFSRGDMLFKELVIPEWPLLAVIPIAGAMLTLEFALRLRRAVRNEPHPVTETQAMDGL